jgi:UDP-N-acetylglucosamine 2-epimerase (non-hydrolysing)
MKAAPVLRVLAEPGCIRQTLVHTGQHYDAAMSDVFFQQMGMPAPDVNLSVGSGSHAQQTAEVMTRFEPVVLEHKPDWVIVYGDVNSTMASALVCAKLQVRVAHVEAGLRSRDRSMPEELNRLVTDQLSDLLLTPSPDADANLLQEGIPREKIQLVGNVMIDTLVQLLPQAALLSDMDGVGPFVLVTLHRPANVDDLPWLREMLATLLEVSHELPVVFPVHPRTRQRIEEAGFLQAGNGRLRLLPPAPYLEFLAMQKAARVVITDSGGIQEETSYLGVPCLTVRENTERPITLTAGTNTLVGRNIPRLRAELHRVLASPVPAVRAIPLWDGRAAERIAKLLAS